LLQRSMICGIFITLMTVTLYNKSHLDTNLNSKQAALMPVLICSYSQMTRNIFSTRIFRQYTV
jgi:hypothetical protein